MVPGWAVPWVEIDVIVPSKVPEHYVKEKVIVRCPVCNAIPVEPVKAQGAGIVIDGVIVSVDVSAVVVPFSSHIDSVMYKYGECFL